MGRTMRSRNVSSYRSNKRSKRGNKLSKRLSKRRVKRTNKRSNKRLNKRSNRRLNRVSKHKRNNRKSFRRRGGAPMGSAPHRLDEAKESGSDDYSIEVADHTKLTDAHGNEYVVYEIVLSKGGLEIVRVWHRWSEVVKLKEDMNKPKTFKLKQYQRFDDTERYPKFFDGYIDKPWDYGRKNSDTAIQKKKETLNKFFTKLARYINDVKKNMTLKNLLFDSIKQNRATEIDLIKGAQYIDQNDVIKTFFTPVETVKSFFTPVETVKTNKFDNPVPGPAQSHQSGARDFELGTY